MRCASTRPSLLERLHDRGDEEAWDEFQQLYRDLILRYCRACGLHTWDAEDVRQIVFLTLIRLLPRFRYDRSRGRFRNYLGHVIRHAILHHRRWRASSPAPIELRQLEIPTGPNDAEEDPLWTREWHDHHLRIAFDAVRRAAHPRDVDLFEHLLAGHTVESVANRFRMSVPAVQKVRQRIGRRLRERIRIQMRDEDGS
jgi:RNA polymerase sigma-70 factor (ECF subfamily)